LSHQYAKNSILRYEWVFGEDYVSTGGAALTRELIGDVALPDKPHVLDVGGGLGGAAFMFEERWGASVIGVDLSPIMVELAKERATARGSKAEFRIADVLEVDFPAQSFDMVWSRDTFLHIHDKAALFARLRGWLAPGAPLVVTDYARRAGEISETFRAYAQKTGYDLRDVDDYARVVREAGFEAVEAQDWSKRFVEVLRSESDKLESRRDAFLERFTEHDYDYLLDRWKRKIGWCEGGDMRAVRLTARAPQA
jgi:phosphoethanolamine N-methyltransferase